MANYNGLKIKDILPASVIAAGVAGALFGAVAYGPRIVENVEAQVTRQLSCMDRVSRGDRSCMGGATPLFALSGLIS